MKTVIALTGLNFRGKSKTLLQLVKLLDPNYDIDKAEKYQANDYDRKMVINNYHGLNIGIATCGDHTDFIRENFAYCIKHKCDICIISVRLGQNYGEQRVALAKQEALNNSAHFVQIMKIKLTEDEQEQLEKNQEMAEMLKGLVDYYVKKNMDK
ncbi:MULTISPECIES: hypothetical protein [Entomomonas]|uniref:Uncharacterized protein n=1 Tax=Entomomonas asaccharolytica TaxID=2785331 RepID=A0A974RZ95_9GAMM|nr:MULTISPECIES: hypothetical protein [Entomomonas]QQP86824.1 hypothetical protein JHT90_06175 [Entomomonas asaccharolytica]UYZ83558.1 hypothetical protein MTZ49_13280 [Entomomonas sp. E2T0]